MLLQETRVKRKVLLLTELTQPAFTCLKLTIETLEKVVKHFHGNGVVLIPLLLTITYFTPCSSVSIVNFDYAIAAGCI